MSVRAWGITVALLCSAQPVHSQYFGRNKVQYDRLDFRVLPTEHFRIHFYPLASDSARGHTPLGIDAARMAERWYTRLSPLLGLQFTGSPLIFYADAPDFQQSNVIEGEISQGTGGVTEGLRERVIMPFAHTFGETDHVLGHEIVHVFQYRIAAASKAGLRSIGNVPLWLIEGMAEYLSLGRDDPHTAMWLRDAVRHDDLPTLRQLTTDRRYFPYRYGQALWAWIAGRWGDAAVARVYRAALQEGWEKGVSSVLEMSTDSVSRAWHADIREAFRSEVASRQDPAQLGRGVTRPGTRGEQNVSPAISPDGRYMAYYSSRGVFGMDLYLAEVATGRVIEQLTSVTSTGHYDALSFISSAGAWSPDGQRLAYVVYAGGDQEIHVMAMGSQRTTHTVRVRGIGAMTDPAWSPDGQSIAFAGSAGGWTDLYVHDLATGTTRRLTTDRQAQLQPAWSPDGRFLAYATDAGAETDVSALSFGRVRLALREMATGSERLLPRAGSGKEINPQFAPDGRSLYFVADHDGVSDVYQRSLDDGSVRRLTRVATGVSGITALAPALSVSRAGTLVFSVFDAQGYQIRQLEPSQATLVMGTTGNAGLLPPVRPTSSVVQQYLEDKLGGLPPASTDAVEAYRSGLSLDYVGGPQLGVAAGGGYGTALSGGIALSFSDELGNRNVQTVLQAQGNLQDVGGRVMYLNRERRWNWGVQGYHIPLLSGFASVANIPLTVGGQQVAGTVFRRDLQRVFYDNAQVLSQYPLSTTRRFEFSLGAQRIGFSRRVDSTYAVGNTVVREVSRSVDAPPAVSFATAAAAYVGDYSFFGFTSPVAGGRYRAEISPSIGSVSYGTALLDYRRYMFARPFTLAVRGMHFGRYGPDAESDRLQPLFVGQPWLLRGYDAGSFDASECTTGSAADECPEFNRLLGSKFAIVSAEIRIPLLGTEQFGLIPLGFLPLEVSPFVDAGVAWSSGDAVQWRFDRQTVDRVPVVSAGVSLRTSLFGYAIAEFYWAQPFQRPGRGRVFGFQLQPGW